LYVCVGLCIGISLINGMKNTLEEKKQKLKAKHAYSDEYERYVSLNLS